MYLPKSASKSKELQDGGFNNFNFTSSFDRARLLFQEIESILESELADTPQIVANYEQNIARVKSKRKRGGPFLIKPLNKSKARKTVNDMEFDPVLGVWVGNDEAMKSFAAHQPALIINKARHDKPKTVGKMLWDPKEHKWKGNEEDLRLFDKRKLPLIQNRTGDLARREIGEMTFDPVKMRWVGNDTDILDFGSLAESTPQEDGFVVGTEFQLSPAATQLFIDCANRHKASTVGWQREEKTREHLLSIRTMSIIRMVRDVKRAMFSYYEEPADMDIAAEKDSKSPRNLVERDTEFDWEQDVGPFNGTVKLKQPDVEGSLDIDVELEQELNKEDKEKKFGSISRGSKRDIVDEDWDNDFAEDLDKHPHKLGNLKPSTPDGLAAAPPTTAFASSLNLYPHGTVTQLGKGGAAAAAAAAAAAGGSLEKKPFALLKADAPQRRSTHNLTQDNKKPKLAWEEDDEGGLEIPAEPLRLKLNRVPAPAISDDETRDLDGEYHDTSSNPDEAFEDGDEAEEEDWEDVDVPPTLGEPVTKRPETLAHAQQQQQQAPSAEKEEWDDFEIPSDKLALKVSQQKLQQQQQRRQQKLGKDAGKAEEEDMLEGIEIPEGFQLRLKKK